MSRTQPQGRAAPRYLRFARALALCGAMAGATAGCDQPERCGECRVSCPGSGDAPASDAAPDPRPLCSAETTRQCCAIVGPLVPPDLPT